MASTTGHSGVSGTVDAFNFIRRIGFPPTPEVVSVFTTITVLSGLLALPSTGLSLDTSLEIVTATILLPTLVGELLNSSLFLRGDPVLNFRRLMGMELVCWWTLIPLLPLSSLIGGLLGNRVLWSGGFLISLALSLPVRFITVFAMSAKPLWRKIVAAILVPAASFRVYAGAVLFLSLQTTPQIYAGLAVFLAAVLVSGTGVLLIIRGVNKTGSPQIGDSPLGLFRDFLRHWLKKEAGPLENRLKTLGTTGRIEVSILSFEAAGKSTASVVVSNFHPGPYRDLGSGGLPSRLKTCLESATGSIALVPHGISNHEYNIISQDDIQKLLEETRRNYPDAQQDLASPLVRETVGDAKASAQVFGKTAFITLTLAPGDMEDIPSHVLGSIDEHAEKRGLHAIVADAHNSLKHQTAVTPDQARMLTEAATRAMDTASTMPSSAFKVGAAWDPLKMFEVEDGIGPGGLSVMTVECQGQHVAYLTIDGNNMETGFRESILTDIKHQGIDEGEVLTTDTHLVAGIVRSPLGYHPVGENMNKEILLARIRESLKAARSTARPASAGFANFRLDLHVLGSSTFEKITSFVGTVAKSIGRSFLRLELAVFSVSILLLLVL